jgi:cation diffusion facilitator CzcD-associated flavoprotein CzcO
LSVADVDIAIIGAGPYGLSLAAHLRHSRRSIRIFGPPMRFWSHHMPQGTSLKSEGLASSLYDPEGAFTLKDYCAENNIPYADIGLPVRIEHFIAYGLEFQRRYVPNLEQTSITSLASSDQAYLLTAETGEQLRARQVVVATGIMNFAYLPPPLADLPGDVATHTSHHNDLRQFKGRRVAVLGAGASALDAAAKLLEVGAEPQLFARGPSIAFHDPPIVQRSLIERIKAPRSGLGTGWRSRLCTDAPDLFHVMPEKLRFRAVERHLGPAPCWFIRDAVDGRLRMHLGTTLSKASAAGGSVRLEFNQQGKSDKQIVEVDHVIAGTGFKVALSRLKFIDAAMQSRIRKSADTPILNRHFESSLKDLFFVGGAAANSFGPLLRFAFGANFAAKRVSQRLAGG